MKALDEEREEILNSILGLMKKNATEGFNEILLYTSVNGKLKVFLQNETIWLNQQKIAELFGVQRPAVTKHLKNIFTSGEL